MKRHFSIKAVAWASLTSSGLALFLFYVFEVRTERHPQAEKPVYEAVFSDNYPVHLRFLKEVSQLRESRLSFPEENLIHNFVFSASTNLSIPSSLLWCLLFQESRLDPLSGVEKGSLTTGLGQFSSSAFFEVNYQLNRYLKTPKTLVTRILGSDVRPISPDSINSTSLHSYYHIPTAVTATALFLHNRRVQLMRAAKNHKLEFSPELLWAWAALSYNKGGRSVISLWQQIERTYGSHELARALTESSAFRKYTQNQTLIEKATHSIWNDYRYKGFSQEWLTHSENLTDCSFIKQLPKKEGS